MKQILNRLYLAAEHRHFDTATLNKLQKLARVIFSCVRNSTIIKKIQHSYDQPLNETHRKILLSRLPLAALILLLSIIAPTLYFKHFNTPALPITLVKKNSYTLAYSAKISNQQENKYSISVNTNKTQLELKNVSTKPENISVYVDKPHEADTQIVTDVIFVDDRAVNVEGADIKLTKTKRPEVNAIVTCPTWNFDPTTGTCGKWEVADIVPTKSGNTVAFNVDHFSAYAGAHLELLNIQTNLTVGNVWEKRFNTYGQSDLSVVPIEGTVYGTDVHFVEFYCGDTKYPADVFDGNKIFIKDYSCDGQLSRLVDRSMTSGPHKLEFTFGESTVVARNFACDVGTLDDTCEVSANNVMTNGSSISGTGNLVLKNGGILTTAAGESFSINMGGDVTIESGGTITGNITDLIADNLDIQTGGTINLNTKGSSSSAGTGQGGDGANGSGAGGAGYGGAGGNGNEGVAGGSSYGSISAPTDLGSGGGLVTANAGGVGGGALKVTVSGTTTVNGAVTANGGNGVISSTIIATGGGSGGSIYITTGTLAGSASITANGGNGGNNSSDDAGGGGGGRIALYYTTKTHDGAIQAAGGTGDTASDGAPGTIYEKPSGQTNPNVTIDNASRAAETPFQFIAGSYTFDTISVLGNSYFEIQDGVTVTASNSFEPSGNYVLSNTSSTGTITYPALDLTTTGTATIIGNSTKWPFRDVTVSSGTLSMNGSFSVRNITVATGAVLTHQANASTHTSDLQLTASGDVAINGTGSINVNAKGYSGTNGTGQGTDGVSGSGGGGAGYGGAGGAGEAGVAGGSAYGDSSTPVDIGSGGGFGNGASVAGGAGGGLVRLIVGGTTTIGGSITANGNNGTTNSTSIASGGGSGGTIYIITETLAGNGTITAVGGNGGNNSSADGGGGGGGRIVIFSRSSTYSGTPSVAGGSGPDSAGEGGTGTTFIDYSAPSVSITNICDIEDNTCTTPGENADPQESFSISTFSGTATESDTNLVNLQIALKDTNNSTWYNPNTNEFDQVAELYFDPTTLSETLPYQGSVNWSVNTDGIPFEIDHFYEISLAAENAKMTTTETLEFMFANTPPTVSNVTASQSSSGVVTTTYDVTDNEGPSTTVYLLYDVGTTLSSGIDTGTGDILVTDASNFPSSGTILIEDELISYTNKSANTLTGTITRGALNTTATAHDSGETVWIVSNSTSGDVGTVTNGTGKSITWTAKTDINGFYSETARIAVLSNDGASSQMVDVAASSAFTLDVKDPAWNGTFKVNASATDPLITVPCEDDDTLQMKIGLTSNLADADWQAHSSSISLSSLGLEVSNPFTLYAQCRDTHSNTSTIESATTPQTPSNLFYQDVSNTSSSEYRLFLAWSVIDEPADGFARYVIHRKVDGGSYTQLTTVTDRSINYFIDAGLNSSSVYSYKVYAEDDNGNISYFSSVISDTPDGAGGSDITPPTLSGVSVSNVSATQASITWNSNKLSNSTVYYKASDTYPGASKASYDSSQGVPSMVSSHSVILKNLTPNTKYYFLVESEDASTNTGSSASATYTFTTTDGPVISLVSVTSVFDTEATITWKTNVPASTTVVYSSNSDLSSPTTVNGTDGDTENHSLTLTGLSTGTKYYFLVKSTDEGDNETVDSNIVNGVTEYYTFTTTVDDVGPVISNLTASLIAPEGLTITWQTNEVATSQLLWDTDPTLNNATTQTNVYTNHHSVTLSDLEAETTYYYQAVSVDKSGNSTTSTPVSSVQTSEHGASDSDETAPIFSNIDVTDITGTTAKVTWLTNENADSFVKFGTTADNLDTTVGKVEETTSHTVTLNNLTASTTYYFAVIGRDQDGNLSESSVVSFTTTLSTADEIDEATEVENELVDLVASIIEKASKSFLQKILSALIKNPDVSNLAESDVIALVESLSSKSVSAATIDTAVSVDAQSQSATVTWQTSKAANSLVAFVPDEDYIASAADPYTAEVGDSQTYSTAHEVILLGLQPNTTYHIQARSKDKFGPVVNSQDVVFTTTALTPEITDLSISTANDDTVIITWKTTVPTRRTVVITDTDTGEDNLYTDGSYIKSHTLELADLSPSSNYAVTITGTDENGESVTSPLTPFSTITTNNPPEISDVKVVTSLISGKVEKVQTIISWRTDKPSDSKVLYIQGVSSSENTELLEIVDDRLTREHILITSAFSPGQVYKYKISSSDIANNTAESQDFTLLTPKPQESVIDLIVKNVEDMFGFLRI